MKKLIILSGMLLMVGTFSSFTTTVSKQNVSKVALKKQTRLAGHYTKNGVTFDIWVEDEPDGWATVVDAYVTAGTTETVTDFSGVMEPNGHIHVSVYITNGSDNFYFSGFLTP